MYGDNWEPKTCTYIPLQWHVTVIILRPEDMHASPNHQQVTTVYSWWNCQMLSTSAICCQLIPQDCASVFPDLGKLAAAELTHHSLKPLRLPYSSRLWLSLLLACDVHLNSGPASHYPCVYMYVPATPQVEESALSATNFPTGNI